MSTIPPPPEHSRHGIAETLALVDRLKAIAFDLSLDDADIARRIRDALTEYAEGGTR
jgi:hypothetical protein